MSARVSGPLRLAVIYWDPVDDIRRHIVLELNMGGGAVNKPGLVGTGSSHDEWRSNEVEMAALAQKYGRTIHELLVIDHAPIVVHPER